MAGAWQVHGMLGAWRVHGGYTAGAWQGHGKAGAWHVNHHEQHLEERVGLLAIVHHNVALDHLAQVAQVMAARRRRRRRRRPPLRLGALGTAGFAGTTEPRGLTGRLSLLRLQRLQPSLRHGAEPPRLAHLQLARMQISGTYSAHANLLAG